MKVERRKLSLFIAILMVVTTLVAAIPTGGETSTAADTSSNIFDELGFDTTAPAGYNADSTPYGRDSITMNQVDELLTREVSTTFSSGYQWDLYGQDQTMNLNSPTQSKEAISPNVYDVYQTVSGDFTGDGKQDCVLVLGANTVLDKANCDQYGANYERPDDGLYAFFVDPTTGTESQSKAIYNGAIGNSFELGGGYLKYDPTMDGNEIEYPDGYHPTAYYDSALLYNYMQVVTGDFTGDGVDEIAIYNPNPASPQIEVYQLQAAGKGVSDWQNWNNWQLIYVYNVAMENNIPGTSDRIISGEPATLVPNKLSMVVGDIDYDGVDDLAVAYSFVNYSGIYSNNIPNLEDQGTWYAGNGTLEGKVIALFGGSLNTFRTSAEICTLGLETINNVDGMGGTAHVYTSPSLAFGDMTNSGRNNIILVESTSKTMKISECLYNHDTGEFTISTLMYSNNYNNWGDADPQVRGDAVAFSPGPGMADHLYYRDLVFSYVGGQMQSGGGFYLGGGCFEQSVTAADINNDSIDEIIISYTNITVDTSAGSGATRIVPGVAHGAVLDTQSNSVTRFNGNYPADADRHTRSALIIATPDTDNDSMHLTYKESYISYTDPKVLAVMAGAPLYQSVEYLDQSGNYVGNSMTSWSSSTGTGTGSTTSNQFSIGAYLSTETDVSILGVDLFTAETESEYSHNITWETEQMSTVTESVQYNAVGYEDAVALYSVPVAVYVYEVSAPGANGDIVTTELYFNIPFSPAVTVMSVDEYEQVALNYSNILPSIRGGSNPVLTHTQGDPSTYPSEGIAKTLPDVRIFSGNYSMEGYGSGSQTQTISIENEETSSTTTSDEFSFKAGAGPGSFMAGVTIGDSFGNGAVNITTSGSAFSGTVTNMPEDARPYGYGFSWKLMQYWYYVSDKEKFPVVSYVVQTNPAGITPVTVPMNLTIDISKSTTSTLTLTWDYPMGMGIDGFKVYRYNLVTQTYELLGSGLVPYAFDCGSYSYTDTGLGPGAQYTYYVQAIRSYAAPLESVPTPPQSGWTLVDDSIKLELSQYQLTAYPDKTYTITSLLTSLPTAGATTYMWEKLVKGSWTELNINTSYLSISNVKPSAAGEYRLRVTQQIGNLPSLVYSPTLTLEVDKRTVSFDLSVTENGDSLVLTAALKNTAQVLESEASPTGTVSFDVSFMGGNPVTYTADLIVSSLTRIATATIEIPKAANGAYEITALYFGDAAFKSGSSDPLEYLKGDDTSIYAVAPSAIYYGDTLSPQFYLAEKNGGQTVFGKLGEGALSNYTITLSSIQKQFIPSLGSAATFVNAIENTDYSVNGTEITPLNLDPNNFTWGTDRGVGSSYHYIATYTVTPPNGGQPVVIKIYYIVNKRPVLVSPAVSEIVQTNITGPLDGTDFACTSPAPGGGLAFNQTFDYLFSVIVKNNNGAVVNWNNNTPMGQYTIVAQANNVPETKYYDFTIIESPLSVTGQRYNATLDVGGNGMAYLSSQTDTTYVFGNRLTFTAISNTGYEVDQWTVYLGDSTAGAIATSQSGGDTFTYNTPASNIYVTVTFKQKDITLTYDVYPTGAGQIGAADGGGTSISNGAQVLEASQVTVTATPDGHYGFLFFRIFTGNLYPSDQKGTVDPNTGVATLSFSMPSESTYVKAMFETKSYEITLGTGLTAWYMADTDNNPSTPDVKVTVNSGDKLEYGTELNVEAVAGFMISEWSNYPASAVFAADDLSCTYIVADDATFEAVNGYLLTVNDVVDGTIYVTIGNDPAPSQEDFTAGVLISAGTEVTLQVVPNDPAAYMVGSWTINGVASFYGYEEITLTMDKAITVTHTLTAISANPMISFDDTLMSCVDGDGASVSNGDTVLPGTELTFSVLPLADDKSVASWSAGPDVNTLSVKQTGGDSLTYVMPQADSYVGVVIEDKVFVVTVVNGSEGTYALDCGTGVNPDAVPFDGDVYLYVTPNSGYNVKVTLNDGSGDTELGLSGTSGGVLEYDIMGIQSDITLTISYLDNTNYTITLDKSTLVSGCDFQASASTAKEGDTITLTATPAAGYSFASWTVTTAAGNPVQVTVNEFVMPAAHVTVKAAFDPIPATRYVLTVIYGMDSTNSGPYAAGTLVTIAAFPPPTGQTFSGWTGGNGGSFADASSPTTTFAMPANSATVTATYKGGSGPGSSPGSSTTPVTNIAVTGVKMLYSGSPTISAGGNLQLTLTIQPADASNKNVIWSSSNPLVASVDSTGLVTAHEEGTATIVVSTQDGGYTSMFDVTVIGKVDSQTTSGSGNSDVWMWVAIPAIFLAGIACATVGFILKK